MKKLFLSLMCVFAVGSAFATPFSYSNVYVDGFAGLNFVNGYNRHGLQIDYNAGYAIGGSVGYALSPFVRIEGEGAYRENSIDELWIKGTRLSASGKIKKATLMANGFVNFPMIDEVFTPYVGLGLGGRWDRETLAIDPVATNEGIYVFDKAVFRSSGFAYQAIAGVTLFTGRKVETTAEYRFLNGCDIQGNHTVNLTLKTYF